MRTYSTWTAHGCKRGCMTQGDAVEAAQNRPGRPGSRAGHRRAACMTWQACSTMPQPPLPRTEAHAARASSPDRELGGSCLLRTREPAQGRVGPARLHALRLQLRRRQGAAPLARPLQGLLLVGAAGRARAPSARRAAPGLAGPAAEAAARAALPQLGPLAGRRRAGGAAGSGWGPGACSAPVGRRGSERHPARSGLLAAPGGHRRPRAFAQQLYGSVVLPLHAPPALVGARCCGAEPDIGIVVAPSNWFIYRIECRPRELRCLIAMQLSGCAMPLSQPYPCSSSALASALHFGSTPGLSHTVTRYERFGVEQARCIQHSQPAFETRNTRQQ